MNEEKTTGKPEGKDESLFGDRLLQLIKDKKINPRPRWHFLLKNYFVWGFGALALLIGAAAVSVMAYLLRYNDWGMHKDLHKSAAEVLLLTLPYFWLVFLCIFVFILYYNIKHAKGAYHYPLYVLVALSVSASVILGALFYKLGLGEKIDDVLGRQAPFYARVINHPISFWSQPDEGRLVGVIIGSDGEYFLLLDRDRQAWKVDLSHVEPDMSEEILLNKPWRLLGEQTSVTEFLAFKILPMMPGRGFFERPEMKPCGSQPVRRPDIQFNNVPTENRCR